MHVIPPPGRTGGAVPLPAAGSGGAAVPASLLPGRIVRGTNEFAARRYVYETWELDETNADGSTQGRITVHGHDGNRRAMMRVIIGLFGVAPACWPACTGLRQSPFLVGRSP